MKKIDVIMTISTAEPSILRYSLSSVFLNAEYLNSIVVAIEKNKAQSLYSILSEYDFKEIIVVEVEENSTKLHKLNSISDYINDENLVIVLDEDDYLLNLENLSNLNDDYDLIITPFFKYQENSLIDMNLSYEHNHIPICSDRFSSFIDNFNSISKGILLKKALKIVRYDFQKLEGVFRGYIYLQLSKKPVILEEQKYSFLIWTKFEGRNHMSSQVDVKLAIKWIKNLLKNLSEIDIENKEMSYELNMILKSNLLRIYRTARLFYLENFLTNDEMNIINKIMENWSIDTNPSKIYNEEMMGVFDIAMKKYKLEELI